MHIQERPLYLEELKGVVFSIFYNSLVFEESMKY
jgi:hypothetical protein